MIHKSQWKLYFVQMQKEIALQARIDAVVDYGEIIYQSPVWKNTRWLVTTFKNEYNVFVDQIFENGSVARNWASSFGWKDRAVEFALQMFLVCCGGVRRQNRWNSYE